MKRLITCLITMTALGVAASTITLDTGALPSTQGWEYKANGLHAGTAETDVVSTDGSALTIDTMGQSVGSSIGSGLLYRRVGVVQDAVPTILEWTSRTMEHETVSSGYYGFFVGFRTDSLDYSVGIFPNRVAVRNGNGWIEIPIDATEYHTYRIETVAGSSNYDFYIDGSLQASAAAKWNSLFINSVLFGDGTVSANAKSDIASLKFSQVTAEIALSDVLNTDGCVEATGPEGAAVHLFADESEPSPYKNYHWSTSLGESGSGDTFECVVGVDEQVEISLTVEDTLTGESGTITRTVCVSDTTAPVIIILSPKNGAVFTGNNLGMKVQIIDAVDKDISGYLVSLNTSYWASMDPGAETSTISLLKPAAEMGAVATDVIVSAQDISGNTASASVQVMLQHDNKDR